MQAKITTRMVKGLTPQQRPYEVRDSSLAGFILRVQPSGLMNYYLVYRRQDGRKTRVRIGRADALSVAQARDLAQQYTARAVSGEDVQATRAAAREEAEQAKLQTLSGFLEVKYEPWLLAERPEKRRSTETLQRLRTNFADILDKPLQDITPWIIEKWRADQRKSAKALSKNNFTGWRRMFGHRQGGAKGA